jgi:hypothetical protein
MREFLADAQDYLPILFQGVQLTVLITLASLVVSTLLGLFWAVLRVSGIAVLAGFSAVMINILRGIPIIVQLFRISDCRSRRSRRRSSGSGSPIRPTRPRTSGPASRRWIAGRSRPPCRSAWAGG